jgi:cyclopropane-fatty-acyl-phospholipid synthase
LSKWFAARLSAAAGAAPVRFVLWDGTEVVSPQTPAKSTVLIREGCSLHKFLLDPELYFGDGYAEGWIEVEGDLVDTLAQIYCASYDRLQSRRVSAFLAEWLTRTQGNSLRGSQRNIHRHYDLDASFFRLWLDSRLVYTCAYFASPDDSLENAQMAKMDYVCRKVRLRQGETVVEAGCGWGALALHMARHCGAVVKAFNISHDQIAYAREWAVREGLQGQVEFIEDDYRNVSGKYDAFVSVGMLEHVGRDRYRELGNVIHRSLADGGRGLLHFIGRNHQRPLSSWIRRRIFPGAYPPTLREAMEVFEPRDLAVLDVENLRLHYALTLEHWLARYRNAEEQVIRKFGAEFARGWRLYLAGSAAAFRSGSLQLFQVSFSRRGDDRVPWTRRYLYQPDGQADGEVAWIVPTS